MNATNFDENFVRKLAELLKETGLNEIEYAEGEKRIRIAAGATTIAATTTAITETVTSKNDGKTEASNGALAEKFAGTPVEAPMVGTVYLAPEPGAAPFVKVGDEIRAGDTLLIIEAMKVMNPIKAPVGGVIKQILVGDAKPVEFGETLLIIG